MTRNMERVDNMESEENAVNFTYTGRVYDITTLKESTQNISGTVCRKSYTIYFSVK